MNASLGKAWLQYAPSADAAERMDCLRRIVIKEATPVLRSALDELKQGAESMAGFTPEVVGEAVGLSHLSIQIEESMGHEDYSLRGAKVGSTSVLRLTGGGDVGVLYGAFHLLRLLACGQDAARIHVEESPRTQLRMINHWDNADGSIERGYAGRSIFYCDGQIVEDLTRIKAYARLLGSVGINSVSINNVNVHEIETGFITAEKLPAIARIADVFRAYGVRLYLSINFAAPMSIGGLSTADPLDEAVRSWWSDTAKVIYDFIPDFGGFVVKADSEHRPGPFSYGRNHADGANMLAEALEPYGGLVIWRCFVYNCMQDWRDRSTDRARAAYDHFKPLDGSFRENVILQVKNGPMDFQVREPVSPLFGGMSQTNQIMEFQITQEYTGQQRHLCYLVPQWKEVLDFDTYASGAGSTVQRIVDGSLFGTKYNGYAAVSNIGDDENWTGHTLAQANLYGYGRLIWNPSLSAEAIAEEWIRCTFGSDEQVREVVLDMLMNSWRIYESYTSPLGVGWMITPNHHYGPDVDGYEYSRWGTYHFADRDGIGVDRTIETGTGYAGQYFEPNVKLYNQLDSCPDELLLFFHHVPYTYVLKSGRTVIQHIYDTHFEGAEEAERLRERWAELEGKIDPARFEQVLGRQSEQAEHAKHWRDVINTYFYRKSGIPDREGRTIY